MKNPKNLLLIAFLMSFTLFSQSPELKVELNKPEGIFDSFSPEEDGRPTQFLTNYLRNHSRLNLNRDIKKVLTNPNKFDYDVYSLRPEIGFGKGTSSLTSIYLDDVQIFGEGINRLYVIQDTRTDEIEKITRSSVNYDKKIKLYTKKYLKEFE